MDDLTDRQQMVLDYIRSHMAQYQRPPTVREICKRMGSTSTNAAVCHLTALRKKGYVDLDRGRPCGIRLVGPPVEGIHDALIAKLRAENDELRKRLERKV